MKSIGEILHHKNYPLTIRDENGHKIYREDVDLDRWWWKRKFNSKGIRTYYEHSRGFIIDHRL